MSRDEVHSEIEKLAAALDANRLAGRRLDRFWGGVRPDMLGDLDVSCWWQRVEREPKDAWETRLVEYVNDCRATRDKAQTLLRPWVIRHNRPLELPSIECEPGCPRREGIFGRAINAESHAVAGGEHGLPVAKEAALPFLLTARAQGELAQTSGARAFFAEGLSSSYEAFNHTRTARGKARDMDDDGMPIEDGEVDDVNGAAIVPTS
jgi:hypothetical protein